MALTSPAPSARTLTLHALLMTIGLCILMPLVGVDDGPFISDEGGVLMQVDTMIDRGDWWAPYPLSDIDPDGRWMPINYAKHAGGRVMPYPSRPAYPALLLVPHRLAGIWGVTAVGLVGVAVAALFAALTAREIAPRMAIPTLWLTGVGTPLIFHGYVLQAHSLGAAAAAAASYIVVRHVLGRRSRAQHVILILSLAGGVLLRRELAFFALALGAASLLSSPDDQSSRSSTRLLAATTGAAGLAGLVLATLVARFVGGTAGAMNVPASATEGLLLADRLATAVGSLLRTTYGSPNLGDAALLTATTTSLAGVAIWLRRGELAMVVFGFFATGLAVMARVAVPTDTAGVVPGLIVASPALAAGVLACGRDLLAPVPRLLVTTFGLFSLAVFATQYLEAGAWEWGARYLAVVLPLLTPLAAFGLVRLHEASLHERRAWTLVAILLAVLMPSMLALGVQRDVRARGSEVVDTLTAVAEPGGTIVSTAFALGRFDTRQLDDVDHRWANVLMGRVDNFAHVATRAGITRFVFVGWGPYDATHRLASSDWTLDGPHDLPTLWVPLRYWIVER